jgi:hypothetical protein
MLSRSVSNVQKVQPFGRRPVGAFGQPFKMLRRGQPEVTFAARAKSSNLRTGSLRYEAGLFWGNFRNCFQSQGRLGNLYPAPRENVWDLCSNQSRA